VAGQTLLGVVASQCNEHKNDIMPFTNNKKWQVTIILQLTNPIRSYLKADSRPAGEKHFTTCEES
jgi:hypothetical protein